MNQAGTFLEGGHRTELRQSPRIVILVSSDLQKKRQRKGKVKKEISRGNTGNPSSFHPPPQFLGGEAERITLHVFPVLMTSDIKKQLYSHRHKAPKLLEAFLHRPQCHHRQRKGPEMISSLCLCLVYARPKGTHTRPCCAKHSGRR